MKRFLIFFLWLIIFSLPAYGQNRTAFMAAYQQETIDGLDTERGASLRTHTTRYNDNGAGWVYHVDVFNYIFYPDVIVGYGMHKGGDIFFEAAAGGGYSFLDGFNVAGFLTVGAEIGDGWFVTLPLTYKIGRSIDSFMLIGFTW